MKTKPNIPGIFLLLLAIGVFSNCSNYFPHTYPFMDWSNPDSVMHSYDTLSKLPLDSHNYICRIWIDPSSTVKQCIEICDTEGGFSISKHQYGYVFNKRHKSKLIDITTPIELDKNISRIVAQIDSLDLMSYKSRYHNWQTDGGPMHTPMIWYRVEYYKKGLKNDFVFWKFVNHDLNDDLAKYKPVLNLINELSADN